MITGKPSARLAHADVDPAHFRFTFWMVYAAHFSMTLATTMFYRIADLVTLLGGTEFDLGWIIGCGTAGGLAIRAVHAVASDAYGPKLLWLTACVGVVVSCAAHLGVPLGWLWILYLIRFFYTAAVNGFFGASITYMSGRAPVTRMAEVIGNLGTAGFIGMIIGPFLLDAILGHDEVTRERMNIAIAVAVVSAAVGTICSVWGTRGDGGWQRRRHPPVLAVIRRYHPGVVLLVAMAGGFALSLPTVFLRPFLEERGITGIAAFFAIYPAVAFVTRLSIRRFPERHGVRAMILIGLLFLVFGTLSYLCVTEWWHVVLPAAMLGVAHAVLFPSLVASSTVGYPLPFRGVGMALVLAAFDMGSLIGMPVAGSVLTWADEIGWPKYPTLFVSVTMVFVLISAAYLSARTSRSNSPKAR
ncbi:MAG: MFS transporter [Planctomycetaceae bacterium]|nr:MFS transporter [Planctomycetaceae bacterium]